jgi:hypothetical protein
MKSPWKATIVAVCLLGMSLGSGAWAQDQAAPASPSAPAQENAQAEAKEKLEGKILGGIEMSRANIRAQRQDIVNRYLDLSPGEAEKFWPIYRDYQNDIGKINDQLVSLAADYMKNYGTLTDREASDTLDNYLFLQKKQADVKKVYVNKFKKAIPNKKVLRLYQLENEMDAVTNYDLAGTLPLAKQQ